MKRLGLSGAVGLALVTALAGACTDNAQGSPDNDVVDLDSIAAGGAEGAGGMAMEPMGPPDPEQCVGAVGDVVGRFYVDADDSNRSVYTEGYLEGDAPFIGDLRVIGADEGTYEVKICSDGTFAISGLTDGTYLVQPQVSEGRRCTTNNCPGRFSRAAVEGQAVMVTFGDSIAVVGDRPLFPERLKTLLADVVTIENRNIAVQGTLSTHWLPGTDLFENRLRAHLADADLVVITLGGNDIMHYVSTVGIPQDIQAALDGAKDVVRGVVRNVAEIIDAIREINPDVDIAYCLYADYSQATEHPVWGLVGSLLGATAVAEVLALAREEFPTHDPHLLMVDMLGAAAGLPLHEYLYDQLHFNTRGQILYAEELFRTVGGVLKGPSPFERGESPLGLERDFGLNAP